MVNLLPLSTTAYPTVPPALSKKSLPFQETSIPLIPCPLCSHKRQAWMEADTHWARAALGVMALPRSGGQTSPDLL
jgi:hypothetical protein